MSQQEIHLPLKLREDRNRI